MNYAKPDWRDGQPFSTDFDDVYFSADNGVEETEHVFIKHNQLQQRFAEGAYSNQFVIAETGFGSGLNFLIAAKYWLDLSEPDQCLHFYSVENTPFTPEDLGRAHKAWPELSEIAGELQASYQVASYGFHSFSLFAGRIKLVLMIGEVETMLQQMQASVDAWFLDGFAPGLNPQMWNETVIEQISRLSRIGSTFSTYTAVGDVKRGLVKAGFKVNKVAGCGKKRHMLCGEFVQQVAENPIAVNFAAQPWYEYADIKLANKKAHKIKHKTACVIGAGIAGLTTAWALVKRGYQVEIIEKGDNAGAQASGNSRGLLMPRLSLQDSADAEFYNTAYFFALRCLQELDERQQVWQQTGGIQLPSSARVKKQIAEYPEDKALVQVLDAEAASELSGISIKDKVHYFPLAACLYPQQVLQQLIKKMGDALTVRYNCEVESFSYEQNQWHLKNQQGLVIKKADCLILASAWQTRQFEQCQHLNLQPARGQVSLLETNEQSRLLRLPISYGGYSLPENNGLHVIGASFVLNDVTSELSADEHQANLDDAQLWFKDMFKYEGIRGGRASVRAVAPDRIPIIGPVPLEARYVLDYGDIHKGKPPHKYPRANYLPGLYVNTGHGARGFTSAFLSAELLAATICDEPLPVSNRVRYALHPARFLIRSLKKKRS